MFPQAARFTRGNASRTLGRKEAPQLPQTFLFRPGEFQTTIPHVGPPGVEAQAFFISPK